MANYVGLVTDPEKGAVGDPGLELTPITFQQVFSEGVGFHTLVTIANLDISQHAHLGTNGPSADVLKCIKCLNCLTVALLSWSMEACFLYFLWSITEPEMSDLPPVLKIFGVMLFSIKSFPMIGNGFRLCRIYAECIHRRVNAFSQLICLLNVVVDGFVSPIATLVVVGRYTRGCKLIVPLLVGALSAAWIPTISQMILGQAQMIMSGVQLREDETPKLPKRVMFSTIPSAMRIPMFLTFVTIPIVPGAISFGLIYSPCLLLCKSSA